MNPEETTQGTVALGFARALVAGEYHIAHEMLSASLRAELSQSQLTEEYEDMIAYGDVPPNFVNVITVMGDWAIKEAEDIGWVYTAIAGDS